MQAEHLARASLSEESSGSANVSNLIELEDHSQNDRLWNYDTPSKGQASRQSVHASPEETSRIAC